jgi:hypothetical protein
VIRIQKFQKIKGEWGRNADFSGTDYFVATAAKFSGGYAVSTAS